MLSYYLNSKEDIKDNSENFDNEIKDEKERFQLPIYYLENKYKLVDNIKSDLILYHKISSNSIISAGSTQLSLVPKIDNIKNLTTFPHM